MPARWAYSSRDVCESLWMRRDADLIPRPMIGDNAGFVWYLDVSTKNKDGAGYPSLWRTHPFDFGTFASELKTRWKNPHGLELTVEPKGNWNLPVDVYWDGELRQTIQYNMGVTGAVLGAFILGTDALAGETVLNRRHRLLHGGRWMAIGANLSTADQDYSVARAAVSFRAADDRQVD